MQIKKRKTLNLKNEQRNYAHYTKAKIDLSLVSGPFVWEVDMKHMTQLDSSEIFQHYPFPAQDLDLIRKLSLFENVDRDWIYLTQGADVAIEIVLRQYLEPGDKVAVVIPTFPRFDVVLSTIDGLSIKYFTDIKDINVQFDAIVLCTPNNPTTKQLSENELRKLAIRQPNSIIMIDAVFERYGDYSLVNFAKEFSNILILKSFSKIGLAGLRLGYIISHPDNIDYLKIGQSPFSVPLLMQKIGIKILKQIDRLQILDQRINTSFKQIKAALGSSVIRESKVPFYLLKTKVPSSKAAEFLFEDGISVVDGMYFNGLGDNYLRVALGSEEDNEHLIKSLRERQIV